MFLRCRTDQVGYGLTTGVSDAEDQGVRRVSMRGDRVIVLGAGFQGVCAALALQRQGHAVTLIDKQSDCMLRASLRNEGKIHLGFVYANDPSFKTPAMMLQAALAFATSIEDWLRMPIDWSALKSLPYTYVLVRDSLLAPEEILATYHKLQAAYDVLSEETACSYLGQSPAELWREAASVPFASLISEGYAVQYVSTAEVAIDLIKFRSIIRRAILGPTSIETCFGHHVHAVERTSRGFLVEGVTEDGAMWRREAGAVVNCLWEGRLRLDEQMGMAPVRKWVYRLKYRLLGALPADLAALPSLTLTLGPFGDIVVNPTRPTYMSWYPASMRGWCTDRDPPALWDAACNGRLDPRSATAISTEVLEAFDHIIPGIRRSRIDVVDAGIIFSWGESDISDPASGLHERHDIGVHVHDGYFSIDTGKFTCAPLFARSLLDVIR